MCCIVASGIYPVSMYSKYKSDTKTNSLIISIKDFDFNIAEVYSLNPFVKFEKSYFLHR